MRASEAKKNVKRSKQKEIDSRRAEVAELKSDRFKANRRGKEYAGYQHVQNEIFKEIKVASSKGKSEHKIVRKYRNQDTAHSYAKGFFGVMVPLLEKKGYVVEASVSDKQETVWHGQMSDLYPTYHYTHTNIVLKVSW